MEDELKTFRLQGSFPLSGWFSGIDAGLTHADREKSKRQPEAETTLGAQGPVPVAGDLQYGLVDLGFAGVGYIPSWNVPAVVEAQRSGIAVLAAPEITTGWVQVVPLWQPGASANEILPAPGPVSVIARVVRLPLPVLPSVAFAIGAAPTVTVPKLGAAIAAVGTPC